MNEFIPVTEKLPPACMDILAAIPNPKRKGHYHTVTMYTGTHPQECVTDDGVVAWMLTPQYTPEA